MIGQTISHYKILEKLGEGGMGVVYKAKDLKLSRTVALKFLPPQLTDDPAAKSRFLQEARTASTLDHINIGTVYDVDEANGQLFIAMAYYEGETLSSRIRRTRAEGLFVPIRETLDIAVQIAEGLAEAHRKEVIHRDIKSDNIFLTGDRVKIMDFGLAKLKDSPRYTQSGSLVGTLAYMSPEQVRGEPVDHRADIFSFGVLLYEVLTGELPFRAEHQAALTYAIAHTLPAPPRSLREEIPVEFERVVLKCLEKERENRFASMEEVARAIETVRALQPGSERPPSNRRMVSLIAAAAALIIGLVVTWYLLTDRSSASAPIRPSIAVMFLEDRSAGLTPKDLATGIADEIQTELSNIPGLQVISRNELSPYRDKPIGARELGRQLGVSYVLGGSVRAEGSRLRFICEVVQTEDGFNLWSQGFTHELKSTLDVQADIAQQVALALKKKLAEKAAEQRLGLPANSLVKR